MTSQEALQIIQAIEENWPNSKPMGEIARRMWGAELMQHESRAVTAVIRRLMVESKWRPSLAEILEPIRNVPALPSAADAFANVWAQVGKRPRVVSDMEAEAVRRMGGWDAIGRLQIDEYQWHAKRFAEIWDDLMDRQRGEEMQALAQGGHAALTGKALSDA